MSAMRIHSARTGVWAACLAAGLAAATTTASAGERHRPLVYLAPATSAVPYSAPAPAYSAPAYSAPYMMGSTFSAPAAYSAPTVVVGNAPAALVGSAPAANGTLPRIKAVDRADLIEDARNDMKDLGDGKLSARRKSLREKVRALYAEAIDDEESALNAAEEQDVEVIVTLLLNPDGVTQAPMVGQVQMVVQQAPTVVQQAPTIVQQAPSMYIQPMMPVQFLVPVQPKHSFFHR